MTRRYERTEFDDLICCNICKRIQFTTTILKMFLQRDYVIHLYIDFVILGIPYMPIVYIRVLINIFTSSYTRASVYPATTLFSF